MAHRPITRDIIELAYKVRRAVKRWTRDNCEVDPEDLCGACAIASYTLYKALQNKGYRPTLVCAVNGFEGHCWVELRGHIIDVTATQFDPELPLVHVVPVNEQEFDFTDLYLNKQALKETSSWRAQSPLRYEPQIRRFLREVRHAAG